MSIPIGFDPASGNIIITGNSTFPARSLVAVVSGTLPETILIQDTGGRGEQSLPWTDLTSLDGSYVPASMADALTYLRGEFGKSLPLSLTFTQPTPALSWTIRHGLGFQPAVSVVDSAGDLCLADIAWPDAATVLVTFGAPTSGTAYLS